jgi:hypothetical protein
MTTSPITPDTGTKTGTGSFAISETPKKGGRPKDPDAKRFEQIGLRPADWEYVRLWAIDSTNSPDNVSTRLERMIARLRAMAPKGPDAFGHERDPAKAQEPRTTPAVALEARRRGITKAEQINEMWELWKTQKAREE